MAARIDADKAAASADFAPSLKPPGRHLAAASISRTIALPSRTSWPSIPTNHYVRSPRRPRKRTHFGPGGRRARRGPALRRRHFRRRRVHHHGARADLLCAAEVFTATSAHPRPRRRRDWLGPDAAPWGHRHIRPPRADPPRETGTPPRPRLIGGTVPATVRLARATVVEPRRSGIPRRHRRYL